MKKLKLSQRLIFPTLTLLAATSCINKTNKSPKRPNILFIMSDDHTYQAISAYIDKLIQTPNIDRIAKEGILFTNACVTNSISAPSRGHNFNRKAHSYSRKN